MKNNKLSKNEINKRLKRLGLQFLDEEYTIIKKKYTLIDEDGYKFYKQLDNLIYRGIPPKIIAKNNPYCIENLQHFYELNNVETKVLSTIYDGNPIKIKCGRCNKIYEEKQIHRIINNKKILCYDCLSSLKKQGVFENGKKIKYKDVENEFNKKGYRLVDRLYKNCDSKIKCIDEYGYLYYSSYRNIRSNNNLSKFTIDNPYSLENIKTYIINNDLSCELLETKYINSKTKMQFKCKCGNKFSTDLLGFLSGKSRCNICSKASSKNETRVEKYLLKNNIVYKREFTFENCIYHGKLRFDFAILSNNIPILLIEVDGEQHFKPCTFGGISNDMAKLNYEETLIKDKIKTDFCIKNKIKLVRIPYYLFKNKEYIKILEKEIKSL